MARPLKVRCICSYPGTTEFAPTKIKPNSAVTIGFDEYETLRLIDYEGYTQEQCAEKMEVSRPTVARLYEIARKAVADVLVNGKILRIDGGDVHVCQTMRPECANSPHCCHRQHNQIRVRPVPAENQSETKTE